MSGPSTRTDPARRARALLEVRLGCAAEVEGSAGGRVNLIGDHVDHAGGPVLPMLLRETTCVAMARAGRGLDEAVSEWSPEAGSGHDCDDGWTRYAFGVLAELRQEGLPLPSVRLAVASDLPVGGGLASSAALEIAVARAACALAGVPTDPSWLARLCQRAEHLHAGTPCGIMDQWCIAHGVPGEAMHLDCATFAWRRVLLPPGLRIEIVDSGVRHALRDGGYAARRADVEAATRLLGLEHLAGLARAGSGAIREAFARLPEHLVRRARHVVTECIRVDEAIRALERSGRDGPDLARFGALLVESHRSLRDDLDVSTPELDAIVEDACRQGALGARMTGGGFGGCAVVAWAG